MMKKKVFTNCFLVRENNFGKIVEVCLGMKKRGFGKGLWNGAGGKPEVGESIEETAKREVQEEFGIKVIVLERRGEINFILQEEKDSVLMNAFLVTKWKGKPLETEEMRPQWFETSEVPYDDMWESDREWLPIVLSGKKIKAKYTYSHEGGKVKTREIREVENFV